MKQLSRNIRPVQEVARVIPIQSEEFSKYIPRGRDGDAIYKITATQNDSEMFSSAGAPYLLKIPAADTNEENRARRRKLRRARGSRAFLAHISGD